jgi:nucleoside 2-deoxyribosyltransferase
VNTRVKRLPYDSPEWDDAVQDPYLQSRAIYLAGPIQGCTYDEIHKWREATKLYWPGKCFDPSDRVYDDQAEGLDLYKELVEYDKAEIAHSDAMLVWYQGPKTSRMTGTTMEIPYAWGLGKLVVIVTPNPLDISPWVKYHSHYVTDNHLDAIEHLVGFFSR